jgi:hypothetical protein
MVDRREDSEAAAMGEFVAIPVAGARVVADVPCTSSGWRPMSSGTRVAMLTTWPREPLAH